MRQLNILFLLFLTVFIRPTQAASTKNTYAYLTQLPVGDLQLNLINPLQPNMALSPIPISIPAHRTVFQAVSSPDGQHIAMWLAGEGNFELYQYDVANNTIFKVKQVPSYEMYDYRMMTPLWSPDSQYIAFNISEDNLSSTYLVSIGNQSVKIIDTGTPNDSLPLIYPIALAWSEDSSYLAVVESDCYNLLCSNDIRALRISDSTKIAEVKIQGTICEVQWSPDNNRIRFAQECDTEVIFHSSEVYVWDLVQEKIDRLTRLTSESSDVSTWHRRYATARSAIWYDSDTILIGSASAIIGFNPSLNFAETAVYQPQSGRVTKLGDEVATDWVKNIHTGELAYYSASVHDVDAYWINFNLAHIRIASFDGVKLSVIAEANAPVTYDRRLAWSLDGQFIAFSRSQPNGYGFLDKTTGKTTEFDLPLKDFITVGWVDVVP